MISTFISATVVGLAQDTPRKASVTGELKIHEGFESKVLGNKRSIRVWLPPKYDANRSRKYPVIYFMDGQNVFDGMTSFIPNQEWRADETATALIESGMIQPVILVGVDNAGMRRANEYLPSRAKLQGTEMGGEADKFGDFLVNELKPYIAQNYNVSTEGKRTGMIGSSFGGIISYYLGSTRPDEFGLLGVMSPSFWWDDQDLVKGVSNWERKPNVKIWMDMGLDEGDSMTKPGRAMRDALIAKGFVTGKDFRFYEEAFAGHNERAWAGRLDLCLQFLMEGVD